MKISMEIEELDHFCKEIFETNKLVHSQISCLLKLQLLFLYNNGFDYYRFKKAIFDIDNGIFQSKGIKKDT